jgi:hypothetical protein
MKWIRDIFGAERVWWLVTSCIACSDSLQGYELEYQIGGVLLERVCFTQYLRFDHNMSDFHIFC